MKSPCLSRCRIATIISVLLAFTFVLAPFAPAGTAASADSGTSAAGAVSVKIELFAGWNLIGVPFETNADVLSRQASISEYSGFKAWYYDAATSAYAGANVLAPGKGYWLEAKDRATVELTGQIKPTPLDLAKGWNLISVSEVTPASEIQRLAKLKDSGSYKATFYYAADGYYYGTNLLVPGWGYWVESEDKYSVQVSLASALADTTAPKPVAYSTYTNSTYWYDVKVPSTWSIDDKTKEQVMVKSPDTTQQVLIGAHTYSRSSYPDFVAYMTTHQPTPVSGITGWEVGGVTPVRAGETVSGVTKYATYQKDGDRKKAKYFYMVIGDIFLRIEAAAKESEWAGLDAVFDTMVSSLDPFRHESLEFGYGISVPTSWDVNDEDPVSVILYEPGLKTRITMEVTQLAGKDMTLDSWLAANKIGAPAGSTNCLAGSEQRLRTKEKVAAYRKDYTFTDKFGQQLSGCTYVMVARGYKFSATAIATTSDWASQTTTIGRMLERFNVRP